MSSDSWMEVLPPTSLCFSSSSWFLGQKRSGSWTQEENKLFEDALAHIGGETPDRWVQVAAMIPGKSVRDIVSHYKDLEDDVSNIEAGRIPFPVYSCSPSSFRLDWANHHGYEGLRPAYCVAGGKRSGGRPDQQRKKGVPWSEEEHKLFLLGLQKYGKGDWRNISRNLVISRTPTQVASHAQKYFIRLNSGGKDKRRSSIHDITFPNNTPPSPSRPSSLWTAATGGVPDLFSHVVDLKLPNEAFNSSANCNQFMQPPLDGMKLQAQNTLQDPPVGSCRILFQMHPRG